MRQSARFAAALLGFFFGTVFGLVFAIFAFAMGGIEYKVPGVATAVPIVTPAEVRFELQNGEVWICSTDKDWDCKLEGEDDGKGLD